MINTFLNLLKVGGIWVSDWVNFLFDPFEEFSRAVDEKEAQDLAAKEQMFTEDMEPFWWAARKIYRYKFPTDSGDQCLWHGIYTTLWAIKSSVLDDHSTKLHECMDGLWNFLSPTGEQVPRLIRGWREDGTYEDEVSNDQATGFLCGIYFGWKYGDAYCRNVAHQLIQGFANELMAYKNQLVNKDHSPTKHGQLENGYLTDPLNLTLCLATYLVANQITGAENYKTQYDRLVKRYRSLIPYANVRLLWWEKTHHAHRAAIHYSILCELEQNKKIRNKYWRGLKRTWNMERKSGNPWIYYLLRRIQLYDPLSLQNGIKHLREFTLVDKQWNVEKINSNQVSTFKWGKYLRVRQPLPRWKAGSQDFFWQRHLYSVDDWVGNKVEDVRHNGGDFLIAYWGLRSLGLLGK